MFLQITQVLTWHISKKEAVSEVLVLLLMCCSCLIYSKFGICAECRHQRLIPDYCVGLSV